MKSTLINAKTITLSTTIALSTLLFSCGDTSNSNSSAPQSMITAANDDGQGVGKYKNIEYDSLDAAIALKGEEVFKLKCTACHKISDQKLVGPGLLGITKRRKASWILNMMTNPLEMTKNDPTAKSLLEKYLVQMTFQDVNDEQAHQILMYLQSIEGK